MKKYLVLKLNPPRPTFAQDMTAEERTIMQKHVGYWMDLMNKGFVLAFGPVIDPAGAKGLGIVSVESEELLKTMMQEDLANGLNSYEWYPMMAVVPQKA
jgi:uncharacterized protein